MDVHIGYCRDAARSVVTRHKVTAPPVNVAGIATALGIKIAEVDLGTLDARLYRADDMWVLELNPAFPITAQRFSLAHEIGHLTLGHEGCGTSDEDERGANIFAAELLMPLALVKTALRRTTRLGDLAKLFQVSKQAMQIKLDEQHLLLKLTSFD